MPTMPMNSQMAVPQMIPATMPAPVPRTTAPPLQAFQVGLPPAMTQMPPQLPGGGTVPPPLPVMQVSAAAAQKPQIPVQSQVQTQPVVQNLASMSKTAISTVGGTGEVQTIKMTGPDVPMTAELKPTEMIPTGPVYYLLIHLYN